MKFILAARWAGVLLSWIAFASAAHATTFTVNESLDLSMPVAISPTNVSYKGTPAFSKSTSLTLDVGDTLDYSVAFKSGQSLSLQNVQYIWGYVGATTPMSATQVVATGQLELLNPDGSVLMKSAMVTDTEGLSHFGQSFMTTDFAGIFPDTVTFSGIRYIGTVDSFVNGSTSQAYDFSGFEVIANRVNVNSTPVPEPASVVLMLAGLGLVGIFGFRRR